MSFPGEARPVSRGMPGKTCYVCGRQFGTKSLDIHIKTCIEKFKAEQLRLPKHLRQKMPSPPKEGLSAAEANDDAFNNWKEHLPACPNCARTFKPDRLEVHLRSCKPGAARRAPVKSSGAAGGGTESATPSPAASSTARSSTLRRPAAASPASARASPAGVSFDDNTEDVDNAPLPAARGEYGAALGADAFDDSAVADLTPCGKCGRNFAADRIAKHEAACSNVKKRKTFNSTNARVKGTEAAAFVRRGGSATAPSPKPVNNWRHKHEEFQRAIKSARQVSAIQAAGGDLSALPPPVYDSHPEYTECPHCGRRFSDTAAARHIPRCATTENKPKPPPAYNRYAPGSERSPRGQPGSLPAPRAGGGGARSGLTPPAATARRAPAAAPASDRRAPAAPTASSAPRGAPAAARQPSRGAPAAAPRATGSKAKFCIDCGTPFAADTQRFCGDCGSQRA